MALIGNYSVLNKTNTRYSNGTSTAGAYAGNTRSNWNNPTQHYAKVRNSFPARSSIPSGYNVGEAYTMAVKSGGLSSFTQINGTGSLVASAILARLSEATLAGIGTISTAELGSIVQAETAMAGVGSITASLGILTNMTASLAGIGSVSANLSAIAKLNCALAGVGSISANLKGNNALSATIVIGGTGYLSNDDTARLADAVWDELTADHQIAGSTGEALADAGAAGNPWSADLASNNTAGTFGAFVQKLLTVAKFLGLK